MTSDRPSSRSLPALRRARASRQSPSRRAPLLASVAGLGACSVVQKEQGIAVEVVVQGVNAPDALRGAWVGLRTVELVPCAVAWRPADLWLGRRAHADHSLDAPTAAVFLGATDLLGDPTRRRLAPPPDDYCFARVVLEPRDEDRDGEDPRVADSVGAALAAGPVRSDRVAWLDQPLDLRLSETRRRAQLRLEFDLADWATAAEQGPELLFETARDQAILTLD